MATDKRIIVVNPDEPNAGDTAYQLYDRAHPFTGEPETIAYFRKQFRGLRGKRVTMTIRGAVMNPDSGHQRPFRIKRQRVVKSYSDIFGPGSMYATALKEIRNDNSDMVIIVFSFTLTF